MHTTHGNRVIACLLGAAAATTLAACGPETGPTYRSCADASRAHAAPLHEGEPGYSVRLDRDGDGVACDAE